MTGDVTVRARAALEGVTEGPWRVEPSKYVSSGYVLAAKPAPAVIHAAHWDVGMGIKDAEFAAAARTLVPELAAEVERLRGALNRIAADLSAHTGSTPDDDDHEIICDVESTIACRIRGVLGDGQ